MALRDPHPLNSTSVNLAPNEQLPRGWRWTADGKVFCVWAGPTNYTLQTFEPEGDPREFCANKASWMRAHWTGHMDVEYACRVKTTRP